MRITVVFTVLVALTSPALLSAQSGPATTSAEPFKGPVGTFEIDGVPSVGIVLRDSLIVDFDAANAALESNPAYPERSKSTAFRVLGSFCATA